MKADSLSYMGKGGGGGGISILHDHVTAVLHGQSIFFWNRYSKDQYIAPK